MEVSTTVKEVKFFQTNFDPTWSYYHKILSAHIAFLIWVIEDFPKSLAVQKYHYLLSWMIK